ncbi:hypothetical protein [Halocynthiibacter namhaensis]|uniref:hypothetical protein n=1 Tax=Halocynthiibacter namhaensis TaxID=1290553 RepID=UPI000691B825|nr:hypothetical protein [Halocynthiibacter namhaensis]
MTFRPIYFGVMLAAVLLSGCQTMLDDGSGVSRGVALSSTPSGGMSLVSGNANSEITRFSQTSRRNTPVEEHGMTRVCGTTASQRGEEVDRAPGQGVRLFDTNPNSSAPRDFYLTGFDDGCARKFTAALALLGAPEVHEAVRYDNMLRSRNWSDVDNAYERYKNRTCGVSKGEHCPEDRLRRLNRNLAFLTVYDRFGYSGARSELLIWKGDVVAREVVAN